MGQLTKDEVFALAVQRYSDTVFRAAMHNCSCTADAEDVVQDVFEKLLRYEGRFESEEHLKAWLLRVAINRCRDITRAARQKDTELNENIPAPESGNDGSVLDAVRTLPENYRNAVSMEAFKESGAGEYSSDVLFGLQLAGAGEQGFDVNAAKARSPRAVELVMLKNRNGVPYAKIEYAYNAKFSYFGEGRRTAR